MKKLMVAACAAMMGMAVSAATVNWKASIVHEEYTKWGSVLGSTLLTASGSVNAGSSQYVVITCDYDGFNEASVMSNGDDATKLADASYYGVVAAVNEIGSGLTMKDYYYKSTTEGCVMKVSFSLESTSKPGPGREIEPGYYPVPEPTSALLVLFGVAGLMLMRKEIA